MNWTPVLLALAALLPTSIGGVVFYRQNKETKRLQNENTQLSNKRETVAIEIDEVTRNNLIHDAANINQQREQEREEWWSKQVRTLRQEIEDERKLSNKRFRRLNQIEEWAMLHVAWDRKAWNKLLESDPDFTPPPYLPEEHPEGASA